MRLLRVLALTLTVGGCTFILPPATPTPPSQPPSVVSYDVIACATMVAGDCTRVIVGASVQAHGPAGYVTQLTNRDGYTLFTFPGPLPDSDVIIDAPGYLTASQHIDTGKPGHNLIALVPVVPKRPAAEPQAPLPAMPPGQYDHTLPALPHGRDFLKADAWGVPVPGLPFVARGSSEHPERVLTYFLYKYDAGWRQKIYDAHAKRGYTHFVVSWPDARDDGHLSLEQFKILALEVKQAGFYVHVKIASKDFDPRDQTPAQWATRLDPVFDALAGIADEYSPWEWDSFNVPGPPTIAALKHMGQRAHAQGASFWLHFFPEHTSWFADGDPRGRFGFYDDLGADIDGLDYQTRPEWAIDEVQARLVDTLTQFARQGNRHKLRFFEDAATLEFTHDHPDERDAALRGYLALCTKANAMVWGAGNGLRYPDGTPF